MPKVEGLTPKNGSPNGGVRITIYGHNLKSKILNIAGNESESKDEGENFRIYLEREYMGDKWTVDCHIDRMLSLDAESLDGKDFIVCLSPPVPRYYRHYVYLVIDNGKPIYAGHIDLNQGSSPTANFFFPAASAPARARDAHDYDEVFWTRWFDTDDNEDGIEDESFVNHWLHDRAAFHNCHTPIGIQVYDYSTLTDFENSENQNADGKAQFEYSDPARGFKCRNELQTITVSTGKKPECPNTKVRYKCNTGIVQMVGRIYTDVHGRSDDPSFHVNRIQQSPILRDETPGEEWKSKADIHLNDGVDCPAGHPNCGHNQRLHLEKVSGNDGLMTFLPKTPIPGAYNFTFDTLYQGAVVVNRRFQNYMNNENLYPSNFEIYPRIKKSIQRLAQLMATHWSLLRVVVS